MATVLPRDYPNRIAGTPCAAVCEDVTPGVEASKIHLHRFVVIYRLKSPKTGGTLFLPHRRVETPGFVAVNRPESY